jgi:putative molybdopterin biosynthesis protein
METRTHLKQVRERRGISAATLAKLAGITRQTVYSIEAGNYVPNTSVALHLAKLLEVSVGELFSLANEAIAPPKSVPVDFITPARNGQPVQLCRVGNRIIGVSAAPQPMMFPPADAIVVDHSKAQLLSGNRTTKNAC